MIDYLSENLWLLWTLVCVLALILEVSSGTFYLLCFAVGAAVAIVSSFFGIALNICILTVATARVMPMRFWVVRAL